MFSLSMLKEKFVIVYGLNEEEIKKINLAFASTAKRECLEIKRTMGNYRLSNLIGGENVTHTDRELPEEKVVILNGFQNANLQQAVTKVRRILGSGPILASTTPNSVKMPLHELMDHLVAERAYFDKRKK